MLKLLKVKESCGPKNTNFYMNPVVIRLVAQFRAVLFEHVSNFTHAI